MSEQFVVLSALAPDRPGLVADLTHYVTERGGNVEESRMLVLGGEFGILVLISGQASAIESIMADTAKLEKATAASVMVRRTKSPVEHRRGDRFPCVITAESFDRVGIVRALAVAIQDLGLNIVDLETSALDAPFTGAEMFKIELRVDVPKGTTLGKVRAAMQTVAENEHLDIEVRSLSARS